MSVGAWIWIWAACKDDTGTDSATSIVPDLSVEVIRARPVCADPGARDALGPWSRVELGTDWVFDPTYHTASWTLQRGGRGIIASDFDGDGHLDLIVPQVLEKTHLLLGDGAGGFTEASDRLPDLADLGALMGPSGGAAADLEGDGDADVFLYAQESSAVLLTNDGTGTFTGVAFPEWDSKIGGPPLGCGGSASWGDLDLDGDLDLFYGRLGRAVGDKAVFCGNMLLRNDGGALVDISDQLPTSATMGDRVIDPTQMRVLASGFVQLDEDVDLELYLVVDAQMEDLGISVGNDVVLDRQGDAYVAWTDTGLEYQTAGMGLGIGDFNGDGRADIAVPGVSELFVGKSLAEFGVWSESSAKLGISPNADLGQSSGWGLEFEDVNFDGRLDLAVMFGAFADPRAVEPDELFVANDAGTFDRMGAAWAVDDDFPTRGLVIADLNEDGWLDLLKREIGGIVVLYLSRCGDAHSVQVSLDQRGANPTGIGGEVVVRAGELTARRYIGAGSTSYQSSGPPVATVGLGAATAIDDIEVLWPDGTTSHSGPVEVDQWVRLVR